MGAPGRGGAGGRAHAAGMVPVPASGAGVCAPGSAFPGAQRWRGPNGGAGEGAAAAGGIRGLAERAQGCGARR